MVMKKKTKILAVGCLHNSQTLINSLAKKAKDENVDLIILAGDLTFFEMSTDNIIGPFLKAKKQVLIIPGNHESFATADFLEKRYSNTKNIHGRSFVKNNLGIFGAGGADVGINQIDDSELLDELNLPKIKMAVSTIPSLDTNLLLVGKIKKASPRAIIIVISHQIDEALRLYSAGAAYVLLPHFLGGQRVSDMIKKHGLKISEFAKIKKEHLKHLNKRKEIGHEHPKAQAAIMFVGIQLIYDDEPLGLDGMLEEIDGGEVG